MELQKTPLTVSAQLMFRWPHLSYNNKQILKDITARQMIPVGPTFHWPLSSTQAFTPNVKKHGLQLSFALIINQRHASEVGGGRREEERND